MSAISATGVSVTYGRRRVLDAVDLSIPKARVVALVGPNGAGKTTLLHVLAGLKRPDAGVVRVLGAGPSDNLPRIALMAQDVPLYGHFSVEDMLRFGAATNPGWDPHTAHRRIDDLGIPLRQKCRSLSGGQRAQVALTLAIGKRPDILLLDEPLASLDPLARNDFVEAVRRESAERGTTTVMSSHLIGDLERLCDHIVVVVGARVVLDGAIADIRGMRRPDNSTGADGDLETIVLRYLRGRANP